VQLDEFKERTADKLRDLVCPVHHRPPNLKFQGENLKTVNVQLSACCKTLIALANQKIANR
jgi:hypothetical protein